MFVRRLRAPGLYIGLPDSEIGKSVTLLDTAALPQPQAIPGSVGGGCTASPGWTPRWRGLRPVMLWRPALRDGLERDFGGQEAGAAPPAGEDPAELDRVEFERRPARAERPGAARRAGEVEPARLGVSLGPLGDDVGDQHAVVLRREPGRPAGGAADVDAVHPGVAGQDNVDGVAERPSLGVAVHHRFVWHWETTQNHGVRCRARAAFGAVAANRSTTSAGLRPLCSATCSAV